MPLQFQPYPLEPWIQNQQNRQRDYSQIPQQLMQGLQLFQQAQDSQRQAALQKQLQDEQTRRWNIEQYGMDPTQMGMSQQSQMQGLGTMFTQPQQQFPSDAPTISQKSQMPFVQGLGYFRASNPGGKLRPNYMETQQSQIDYRDPSTWINRNDISLPHKTMLSGLFGKVKDSETQSDYKKLRESLDIQLKQAQIDALKTKGEQGDIKQKKEQSKLESTLELYEAAREGLMTGLEGATTGPVLGRIPAFSAKSQVAEGGVAAMAPVLKQLFRVAGEGVFTDRDQALLLAMIPTRAVRPEARKVMMENIDNIVKAKLGMAQSSNLVNQPTSNNAAPMTATNPKTGQKITSYDGGQTWQ